jgi:general secretion pathway protein F
MQFEVRAIELGSAGSRMVTLTMEAANEGELRAQLRGRSIRPVAIVPRRIWRAAGGFTGDSNFSVSLFSQELLTLLEAGLSVMDALDTLSEQKTSVRHQSVVRTLKDAVVQGNSLSGAMQQFDGQFSSVFIGLIRAAESTSDLAAALRRLVEYQTQMEGLRSRVVASAIYPAVLLFTGSGVGLFLMLYVVPRFASVYQGSGRPLPWMSAALFYWGQMILEYRWVALGLAVLLLGATVPLVQWGWRSGRLQRALQHMPAVGERMRVYTLSRMFMTLGMLLEGGIAVVPALNIVGEHLVGKQRDALAQATRRVQSGESLSAALNAVGLATPVSSRLLVVGEKSGNLGAMLRRSAGYHDAETARWLDRFSRLFEPLLMVAIGLVVGLIVILLYMPIFDLAGSLQ